MATDPRQSESRLEDRVEDRRLGVGRSDWSSWPTYEAAALGLPGSWWYPVMWSARLGRRPVAERLLGERVVFARDGGQVVASNGPDSPPVAQRLGLIWVSWATVRATRRQSSRPSRGSNAGAGVPLVDQMPERFTEVVLDFLDAGQPEGLAGDAQPRGTIFEQHESW